MKLSFPTLIRNIDADMLIENFLVSAVAAIFGIRFYLFVAGYPQIGGREFHVAHMLWGGFLMLAALFILLAFLNRSSCTLAAIIGGVGFGAFIDELGKFITRDNNYFFQPTVAIVYVIFILLYLLAQMLDSFRTHSRREYLVNAIELIKDAVENDLSRNEMRLAREYLQKSDPHDPLVSELKDALGRIDVVPQSEQNVFSRIRSFVRSFYINLVKQKWFLQGVLIIFGLNTLLSLFQAVFFFITYYYTSGFFPELPASLFAFYGQLVSSTIAALLVVAGACRMRTSRLEAFRIFKYSVIISILFTQFFAFYQEQFYALGGLFANIFLFAVLQYVINEELTAAKIQVKH